MIDMNRFLKNPALPNFSAEVVSISKARGHFRSYLAFCAQEFSSFMYVTVVGTNRFARTEPLSFVSTVS